MPVRKHNRTALTGKHATPDHPPRGSVSTRALREGQVKPQEESIGSASRKDEPRSLKQPRG